jgi:hypothetical protein
VVAVLDEVDAPGVCGPSVVELVQSLELHSESASGTERHAATQQHPHTPTRVLAVTAPA